MVLVEMDRESHQDRTDWEDFDVMVVNCVHRVVSL